MSSLRRRRYVTQDPITSNADDSNVMEGYINYNPSLSDTDVPAFGTDDLLIDATPTFPGQRELIHGEFQANVMPFPDPIGNSMSLSTQIDYEIGGAHGIVNRLPYSLGVVSSDLVENFELTGEQALIRRGRNPSIDGVVGTSDPNSILAIVFASQVNQFFPNDASQGDLVRAV